MAPTSLCHAGRMHEHDQPPGQGPGQPPGREPGHRSPHDSFDDDAAGWDDRSGHRERAERVAHGLRAAVPLDGSIRALEVGAGTGLLSRLLAGEVGSVVVTDPSAGMVAEAERAVAAEGLGDRLTVRQADLTADPAGVQGPFDVAWMSMALHHVPDVDLLLRRVRGLLADGGWLAVADLDDDPDGAFHRHREHFAGHHGFDRADLTRRLEAAGFGSVTMRDIDSVTKRVDGRERDFGVFLAIARCRPLSADERG